MNKESKNKYPNCIRYSPEHSAGKSGDTDIIISYREKVIGQTRGNLSVGNDVLVLSRDKDRKQITVFVAEITEKLKEHPSCWAEKGGKIWKHNWSISPKTKPRVLYESTVEHVLGHKPNWQLANSSFMGGGKNVDTVGIPRQKIIDHLLKLEIKT
jgi:hypothetical protein